MVESHITVLFIKERRCIVVQFFSSDPGGLLASLEHFIDLVGEDIPPESVVEVHAVDYVQVTGNISFSLWSPVYDCTVPLWWRRYGALTPFDDFLFNFSKEMRQEGDFYKGVHIWAIEWGVFFAGVRLFTQNLKTFSEIVNLAENQEEFVALAAII